MAELCKTHYDRLVSRFEDSPLTALCSGNIERAIHNWRIFVSGARSFDFFEPWVSANMDILSNAMALLQVHGLVTVAMYMHQSNARPICVVMEAHRDGCTFPNCVFDLSDDWTELAVRDQLRDLAILCN